MKKFQQLLINSIDEEITGTTIERLVKAKEIFENEMLKHDNRNDGSEDFITRRLQDWLQGLCGTIAIPFENYAIIEWYEAELGRPATGCNESFNWLERYWPQCARSLYRMFYK